MEDLREQRGLIIAATKRLAPKGNAWIVPSCTESNVRYTVVPHPTNPYCTCPDFELRGERCKHIHAVNFTIKREQNEDGSVTETKTLTLTEKKTTYPQNWAAYNKAQTNEKALFQKLLHDLCRGLADRPKTNGRQFLPMADAVFAACFKVYSTLSARRFMTDLRAAHDQGYIRKCPCHNSVLGVLENEDMFPVLKALVERSSVPLKPLETNFACDSSGFAGCRYERWIEHKYGPAMKKTYRTWVKAHVMTGTKTNVITAVEILDYQANDGKQLEALFNSTTQRFDVKELTADLAYSTKHNLALVDAGGAVPLIPFKQNASPESGGMWAKMYYYFSIHRDEFLRRYHQRSNVESTFSAVKRKFGDSLRSKTEVAMRNETLAKFLCHNICVNIQEMYESGITPYWAETSVAQQVAGA